MKCFYSDYAEHILRNYFYPPKRPQKNADELNLVACDKTMQRLTDQARIILKEVLQNNAPLPDCVQTVSEIYKIPKASIWRMIDQAKFYVAMYRGLL